MRLCTLTLTLALTLQMANELPAITGDAFCLIMTANRLRHRAYPL